jgi:hypothetical protein
MSVGYVGLLIGDVDHAPTRIAFITICFVLSATIICLFVSLYRDSDFGHTLVRDTLVTLMGLASTALGYLFGSGANRSNRRDR